MIKPGKGSRRRLETLSRGFAFAQPCPADGEIENLYDLGANGAAELPITPNRVLASDAPLLVRRGS